MPENHQKTVFVRKVQTFRYFPSLIFLPLLFFFAVQEDTEINHLNLIPGLF